jgi:hypothetical protein
LRVDSSIKVRKRFDKLNAEQIWRLKSSANDLHKRPITLVRLLCLEKAFNPELEEYSGLSDSFAQACRKADHEKPPFKGGGDE